MSSFGPEIRRLRVACLCCKLYSCKCDKFWGTCVHAGRRLRVRSSHDLHACFFGIESNLCPLGSLVSVFQNSATTGEGEDARRLCTASGQGVVNFSNRTDSCSRPPTQTHACTRNSSISSCLHTRFPHDLFCAYLVLQHQAKAHNKFVASSAGSVPAASWGAMHVRM